MRSKCDLQNRLLSMPKFLLTLSAKSWTFSRLVLAVLLPRLSEEYLRGPFGLRKFVILRHDSFDLILS